MEAGSIKITMEKLLSFVIDNVNVELLQERDFHLNLRKRQCQMNQLKSQTLIEVSSNDLSPSVTLLELKTYVESAGSVLKVYKNSRSEATIT